MHVFMDSLDIIPLIKELAKEKQRTPTVHMFAEKTGTHASSIIRKFGSWNELLKGPGCP